MNDIYNPSKLLSFILFADDTTLFLSDKDDVLYDTMNNELKEVCKWFNNKSLNASKPNLMLLATAYKTKKNVYVSRSIYLDGCQLIRITNAKFLA